MNVPLSKSFVILKQIPDKLPNRPKHIRTFQRTSLALPQRRIYRYSIALLYLLYHVALLFSIVNIYKFTRK